MPETPNLSRKEAKVGRWPWLAGGIGLPIVAVVWAVVGPSLLTVDMTDQMVAVPAGEFWMGCNEQVDKNCDADYLTGPTRNLRGPATETYRSARGGSWDGQPAVARASYRRWYFPGNRYDVLGVRCAQ